MSVWWSSCCRLSVVDFPFGWSVGERTACTANATAKRSLISKKMLSNLKHVDGSNWPRLAIWYEKEMYIKVFLHRIYYPLLIVQLLFIFFVGIPHKTMIFNLICVRYECNHFVFAFCLSSFALWGKLITSTIGAPHHSSHRYNVCLTGKEFCSRVDRPFFLLLLSCRFKSILPT